MMNPLRSPALRRHWFASAHGGSPHAPIPAGLSSDKPASSAEERRQNCSPFGARAAAGQPRGRGAHAPAEAASADPNSSGGRVMKAVTYAQLNRVLTSLGFS